MTQVHAPYHFVPLSKWVYMPDWAHLVSHDVPFEDGISGVIDYTLTNNTPLCVGDKQDEHSIVRIARNHPGGRPIIPGSSIKGMLRNTLDIAAFGKFNQVDDRKLSYRDITGSDVYKNQMRNNKAGWLNYDRSKKQWSFTPCKFVKVHNNDIRQRLGIDIQNHQSAIEKYSLLPITEEVSASISEPIGKQQNRWARELSDGSTIGHCIFVNDRVGGKANTAKYYDFSYFFYDIEAQAYYDIEPQVTDCFRYNRAVKETIKGVQYDQVSYMQENAHPEYGIPVFASFSEGKVHSLGFAKMHRLPFKNSIHDLISNVAPEHLFESWFSLSELIFGTLREQELGIKSRVNFSDAILKGTETTIISGPLVLGTPKPSFVAAYLEQPVQGEYQTYGQTDDENKARLAGWKRYPVQDDFTIKQALNDNQNVASRLELLTENHQFTGRITFHNLKPEELAAMVWVITLNNSRDYYHTLGHGKPFGAGSVQFEIKLDQRPSRNNSNDGGILSIQELVDAFTSHMEDQIPGGRWLKTPQVKHLLAMSDECIAHDNDNYFTYPVFDSDYVKFKDNKRSLKALSYMDSELSRIETVGEKSGSLAFGNGRLKHLFDDSCESQQAMRKLSEQKVQLSARRSFRQQQTEKAEQLESASPFEKCHGLLCLIAESQLGLTATYKAAKAKEIRAVTKELKQIDLTDAEVKQLIVTVSTISIAERDVNKLTKWLEKL